MVKRIARSAYRSLRQSYHARLITRDFQRAKAQLISSSELTEEDKILVRNVPLRVHTADGMYERGNAFHYLSTGLSAYHCIDQAVRSTSREFVVSTILDLPCGYGRVLRFLRTAFPNSEITAGEIDGHALEFCRRSFSANTVLSPKDLNELSLSQHRFDLIWCGSLLTHVDDTQAGALLEFFHGHLSDPGVCIVTTHGNHSIDLMQTKKQTYGLSETAQAKVIHDFQASGYGYADYPNQSGYGISVVEHQRMLDLASRAGKWKQVMFTEQGWDNHQDVYAFEKHSQ